MGGLIAGTGHRPDKLGGWENGRAWLLTVRLARNYLEENEVIGAVSGMAAGWDLALAHAAMELEIPLKAAIPFWGQEDKWTATWKYRFNKALEYASVVHCVSGGFSREAYLERNRYMVDYIQGKAGKILALYDGSPGGTQHCVHYAESKGVEVINLWNKFSSHMRMRMV